MINNFSVYFYIMTKNKNLLYLLLAALVVLICFGALLYFLQNSKSNTTPDLIPGNTDTSRNDGLILVGAIYKYSLNPSAIWVEYGTSPDKFDNQTNKTTQEIQLGDSEAVYAEGLSQSIKQSDLAPKTTYYYRVAATVNGKTLYSAPASFETTN